MGRTYVVDGRAPYPDAVSLRAHLPGSNCILRRSPSPTMLRPVSIVESHCGSRDGLGSSTYGLRNEGCVDMAVFLWSRPATVTGASCNSCSPCRLSTDGRDELPRDLVRNRWPQLLDMPFNRFVGLERGLQVFISVLSTFTCGPLFGKAGRRRLAEVPLPAMNATRWTVRSDCSMLWRPNSSWWKSTSRRRRWRTSGYCV